LQLAAELADLAFSVLEVAPLLLQQPPLLGDLVYVLLATLARGETLGQCVVLGSERLLLGCSNAPRGFEGSSQTPLLRASARFDFAHSLFFDALPAKLCLCELGLPAINLPLQI